MEFFELVQKRKSIRAYRSDEIEDEKINKILEVVNLAPSAGNLQAYKIYVVKNKQKISEIAKACFNQKFISQAPVVMVFCANPKESEKHYEKRGKELYSLQDATIAATFAVLACYNLGLSTCWVGAFDEDHLKSLLNTNLRPIAVLPIGYPKESPERRKRKSLKELAIFIQ